MLDLKTDDGRTVLTKLVERADVLLENFRPGVLDRLGFGNERLLELNPRLVILSISGFGHDGPEGGRAGYDQIAQGEGGADVGHRRVAGGADPGRRADRATCWPACTAPTACWQRCTSASEPAPGRSCAPACSRRSSACTPSRAPRYTVAGEIAAPDRAATIRRSARTACSPRADGFVQIAVGSDRLWDQFAADFGLARPEWATNRQRVGDRAR